MFEIFLQNNLQTLLIVLAVLLVVLFIYRRTFLKKRSRRFLRRIFATKSKYAPQFEKWKNKISKNADENTLNDFMLFLRTYQGGLQRRRRRKESHGSHSHDYFFSGREFGDLKGIFLNVIVPCCRIRTPIKEEFRSLLIKLGVRNLNDRPNYEERDAKLRLDSRLSEDDKRIKQAGNIGESAVRKVLEELPPEYRCVSGICLQINQPEGSEKVELDHLVVGTTGVFVLETKAFGITHEGKCKRVTISVDEEGKWHKAEYGVVRDIPSPEPQLIRQYEVISNLLKHYDTNVRVVLVLANENANIGKIQKKVPFMICNIKRLAKYILKERTIKLSPKNVDAILSLLDSYRIN